MEEHNNNNNHNNINDIMIETITTTDDPDCRSNIDDTSNNNNDSNSSNKFCWLCSFDAVEILCSFVVLMISLIFEFFIGEGPPMYIRPIPVQQLEISADYVRNLNFDEELRHESIHDMVLIFVIMLLPMILQLVLIQFIGKENRKRDLHGTICIYFYTFGFTLLATDLVKHYVGYFRPAFFTACEPSEDYSHCTNEDINRFYKSFPSGHASMSFCALTLFSLYLQRNFGIASIQRFIVLSPTDNTTTYSNSANDSSHPIVCTAYTTTQQNHPPGWYRVISILCHFPYAVALFVATSRVHDNYHHPADVVGGSVLGVAVAISIHRLWYPHPAGIKFIGQQ